jgi:hypothetical protein
MIDPSAAEFRRQLKKIRAAEKMWRAAELAEIIYDAAATVYFLASRKCCKLI